MPDSKIKQIEKLVDDEDSLKVSKGLGKSVRYDLELVQVEIKDEIQTRLIGAREKAMKKLGVKIVTLGGN